MFIQINKQKIHKRLSDRSPKFWIGLYRQKCEHLWTGPEMNNKYRSKNYKATDQRSTYVYAVDGKSYDFLNGGNGFKPHVVVCRTRKAVVHPKT